MESSLTSQGISLVRGSPGLALVAVGFITIYFLVGVRGSLEPTMVTYLSVGFGFLVTLAGIVLLFRDLGRTVPADSEVDLSVGSSDIEHAVRQLGKNYDILRRQATQGFVLAGTFMALGILVILAGSLGEMFGFTKAASNLTTVAGVMVEAVSGLGLYLFKETFKRLNATSDRLHEMWKILAAFTKAETLPDEKKSDVIISLINKLVEVPLLPAAANKPIQPTS
jgi:hypothetical protein